MMSFFFFFWYLRAGIFLIKSWQPWVKMSLSEEFSRRHPFGIGVRLKPWRIKVRYNIRSRLFFNITSSSYEYKA